MSDAALRRHLEQEHGRSLLSSRLRELVAGGLNGLITAFAIVAGFQGAAALAGRQDMALPLSLVVLFGLASLLANGLSLALRDFLTRQTEQRLYEKERRKEAHEVTHNPAMEREETLQLLKMRGLSDADAQAMTDVLVRNPSLWVDFMMRYELEMDDQSDSNPIQQARITLVAFLGFGLVPLLPYILGVEQQSFALAALLSCLALVGLGLLRARFAQEPPLSAIIKLLAIAGLASLTAYGVGTLF